MATTSIWRVNGWLGKVLIYIENPDKTENPDFFEKQDMDGKEAQGLSDVIEYAVQQQKTGKTVESEGETVMRQFVSGVNCRPATARDEMIAVKKRFGKEDGTVAYHGYQSFAPGEATPELAHEIGLALAKKLWGEKYQVLVATHLDRENHLHNHFVVNTVSFVDGIKSYAAVCLEGAIIVLACIIFSLFAAAPPAIDPNAAAVTQVWSYIGELVFNMLVLVGAVKMADRVVREMMGL